MSFYNFNVKFIDFIYQSIFQLVEMWLDVLVIMFLFNKYTNLNIFLICVPSLKCQIKMILKKVIIIYTYNNI